VVLVVVGTWGVGMSEHIYNMGAGLHTSSPSPARRRRRLMAGGAGAGALSPVVVVVHWDAVVVI
jgi:hypothetical protein